MGNIAGSYNSSTGVMTLTSSGSTATLAQWQAALRAVAYSNTSESPNTSTRTVQFAVSDGSNTSTASMATVSVYAVNDAPVLADTTLALSAVRQDAGDPSGAAGTLVSALVGGQSDVDSASAPKGVAITGVNANGTLYYSTNGGSSWTAVSGASNTNALLLASDADNRLYFKPNAGYYGTLSDAMTFRAWDQSSGLEGSYVSTAVNGGTSAFSTATDTIAQQVVRAVTINTVSTDSIVINGEAFAVSGTAEANATVALSVNGTTVNVTADASGNWSYDSSQVRYVMVRKNSSGLFAITEIQAFAGGVNVALNKTANLMTSSNQPGYSFGFPERNTDGNVDDASFESNYGDHWVQVDLGGYYSLDSVTVYARRANQEQVDRLNGATIYTSTHSMSGMSISALEASGIVHTQLISGMVLPTFSYTDASPRPVSADILLSGANTITATQTVSSVTSTDAENVTMQEFEPGVDGYAPVFNSGTTASVAENISTATTVYDAQAKEVDANNTLNANNDVGITYSLSGTDAAKFTINASTGEVKFVASPNFAAE